MIDLHMHTFFSDGALIPSELMQRARSAGYKTMAITDHADSSNIESLMRKMSVFLKDISGHTDIKILSGVELTHVIPSLISSCTKLSRDHGAQIVLCHGETVVEPVIPGTNRAAIEAGVDILAHPGLIAEQDVILAAEKGVCLELTTRRGHCLTNGHVARLAKKYGAKLVLNTDTHAPNDLMNESLRESVILGAGLCPADMDQIINNSEQLVARLTHIK